MNFTREIVNPQFAKRYLATQVRNRPIKWSRVHTIAEDMKNARYTEQPHPICIGINGRLIDGQHRLLAINESGCSIPMWVAYDVPEDIVLDKGLERSTGDALFMRGLLDKESSTREIIAITNRYYDIIGKRRMTSDTVKANFINCHRANLLKAASISRRGNHSTQYCKKAGVQVAIFAALESGVDESKLLEFAQTVNNGFMDNQNQAPAILLRNYIVNTPMTGSVASNNLAAYSEMAIKDFVAGTPRKRKYKNLKHIYIDNIQ